MTTIYLVRHGQTDFNRTAKLAGRLPGVHLNSAGRSQAEAAASFFRSTKLVGVFSSPLERAAETAASIANGQDLPVETRDGLSETIVGDWEGLSLKQIRRRKLWPTVRRHPALARFPEGESFLEAQSRIVSELEMLRSAHPGERSAFVCVSHADPIKLAIAHYLGLPIDMFQRLMVSPASISQLTIANDSVILVRLNHRPPVAE